MEIGKYYKDNFNKKVDEESKNLENCDEQLQTPYSAEEALALIEDVKLSKYQYEVVRMQAEKKKC